MSNAVSGARPTVDLGYAESYFAARLYATAWTDADANDKVKALEQASILLAGAVDFAPDACTRRDDGTAVWHERALAAVCEEALWLLTRDPTRVPELMALGIASGKVGELSATFDRKLLAPLVCDAALQTLGRLGTPVDGASFTSTPLAF